MSAIYFLCAGGSFQQVYLYYGPVQYRFSGLMNDLKLSFAANVVWSDESFGGMGELD